MTDELKNFRVAFVVANERIEQADLTEPWQAVVDAGGRPTLIAPLPGEAHAVNHFHSGDTFWVDVVTDDARAANYDAVVLPGGISSPDDLSQDAAAVDFLMAMFEAEKPLAAICHGPRTLVDGDLVRGRTITSWPGLQTDLRDAGANWVDEEVTVCGNGINVMVTSRRPEDLPVFCREMTRVFADLR